MLIPLKWLLPSFGLHTSIELRTKTYNKGQQITAEVLGRFLCQSICLGRTKVIFTIIFFFLNNVKGHPCFNPISKLIVT